MDIKTYEEYKPIVIFYNIDQSIYFKYNDNFEKASLDTINELKQQLVLPYKISFIGISRANLGRILSTLKDDDNEIFCYRIKNPKSNSLKFNAIFTEKRKIKKLEK